MECGQMEMGREFIHMPESVGRVFAVITACIWILFAGGCSQTEDQVMDGGDRMASFYQITQKEAAEMMGKDDDHVIVDVRRQDEYEEGHIPGAICIPNESIGNTKPEQLPDTEQIILVYCRSGRRSKEAAQKLFDMGYTNVYEFGGIIDWTGEVVRESE